MAIHIDVLGQKDEPQYRELLASSSRNLLYTSLEYRDFLRKILPSSQDCYLVAYKSGWLAAALPSFLMRNERYGNMLNSLPFYGSNGGIVLSPAAQDDNEIKIRLLAEFRTLAEENDVIASTIISNPLLPDKEFYDRHTGYTFVDQRIGQFVVLPNKSGDQVGLENCLMRMYHQKTRNMIRKAKKSGVRVSDENSIDALKMLAELHRQNMEAIGARAKSWTVFEGIWETFAYDNDYKVYLAHKDENVIAALLVLFSNRTAEYFVPATHRDFRRFQPMSLLIFEVMQEAVRRGFRYWNWGGTWLSQDGVYRFKKRWGTEDRAYFYYTRIFDKRIMNYTKEQLLDEYPNFYVLPFPKLKKWDE